MSRITLVLADDHQLVRQGLRALLGKEADFEIVGEAGDGVHTIRMVQQLRPRVLVLDLMMPSLNGMEVTRQIARQLPRTKIVVLSMHANEAYVLEALRSGASGYVLKDCTSADLVCAIRDVAAGRRFLSAPFSASAIDAYLKKTKGAPVDPYETLTTREREILQLVAEACTNADIARKLFISERTVETHRAHMMGKLALRTQADVMRYAIQRGVLQIEPATLIRAIE